MVTINAANNATGATGTVLAGQGVGTASAFTATPALTSVTVGGGTALGTFVEGTFTPVIQGASTAGVGTYTVQSGFYQKVGIWVHFTLACTWTAHTGTGVIQITGLPFNFGATTTRHPCVIDTTTLLCTTATDFQPEGVAGGNTINLFGYVTSTGTRVSTVLASNTNTNLTISGTYST